MNLKRFPGTVFEISCRPAGMMILMQTGTSQIIISPLIRGDIFSIKNDSREGDKRQDQPSLSLHLKYSHKAGIKGRLALYKDS